MTREDWLAIRKEEGFKIDPSTAEVDWIYAQTVDPYGVYPEPPDEWSQVGREYFARQPDSEVWVDFGDLPKDTRDALWGRYEHELAFPAGLGWDERGEFVRKTPIRVRHGNLPANAAWSAKK